MSLTLNPVFSWPPLLAKPWLFACIFPSIHCHINTFNLISKIVLWTSMPLLLLNHLWGFSTSLSLYTVVAVQSLSCVRPFATPWTVAHQAPLSPLSMEFFQAWVLEWFAISFSRGSSWTRERTHVSCFGRHTLYLWATWEAPLYTVDCKKQSLPRDGALFKDLQSPALTWPGV